MIPFPADYRLTLDGAATMSRLLESALLNGNYPVDIP
jgi:hypothetical protein